MNHFFLAVPALLACLCLPCFTAAQPRPDLQIESVSVSSTLVEADGQRRVTVSFRIRNSGNADAVSSITRIVMAGDSRDYVTPLLAPGTIAFISRSSRTNQTQMEVSVHADIPNGVTETNEQNNRFETTSQLIVEEGRWISIGPSRIKNFRPEGVGRITAIAVDPLSFFVVYAGARGSGLWKTTDMTGTWAPISDSLPSLQIDAIAIDPLNHERVFVATPSGLFESKDGGSVWTQKTNFDLKASGSNGGAFLITKSVNPVMYLTTQRGLMVSTNGGTNWNPVLGSTTAPVKSLQFSTIDPTRLYAAQSKQPGIFEATNGGLTANSWRRLQGCPGSGLPAIPAGADVWITESQGSMYISFRVSSNGLKVNQIWRSTATTCNINGATEHAWENVPLSGDCNKFENHWSYLFAHPTNPEILFKGGVGLCRSKNSGLQMRPVGNIHVDHHAIAVSPSAPAVMFFGSDGGISRSPDKGNSLRFINEGLNNTEFLEVDTDGASPRIVTAGSHDNGFSTWDGLSPVWNYVGGGDSAIVEFDINDARKIYEMGQSTRQIKRYQSGSASASLGTTALPDVCTYSESNATVFNSMISIGGSRPLALTARGIWTGPPWTEIMAPALPGMPTNECERNQPGDVTKLKLGPTRVMAAVTNTGGVFFGLPHQPPLANIFQSSTAMKPSAIAFAGPGTFYVSFNDGLVRSIYRFQCFAGCQREVVCADNQADKPCPGDQFELTALVADPALPPEALFVALRGRGIFRGVRDPGNGWTWSGFNNGLPFGVTITDLEQVGNGSIIAATYGRGAYRMFSRIPVDAELRGRITWFEAERMNPAEPPGSTNPVLTVIEIDSKPGWRFSTTNVGLGNKLKLAHQLNKLIRMSYQSWSPNSAKILSVVTLP